MNRREMVSKKQTSEKILSILGTICSISIIVLAGMQIFGIWKSATIIFEPLLGVLMLIQAMQNWEKNRKVAKISLGAAIFIFLVSIFIFITR